MSQTILRFVLLWGCKLNANDKIVLFLFSHSNQSFIPFQRGMAWHGMALGMATQQINIAQAYGSMALYSLSETAARYKYIPIIMIAT